MVQMARVVVKYERKSSCELSLDVGAVVHVLRSFSNGWLGVLTDDGEKGFFPEGCLAYISPVKVKTLPLLYRPSCDGQRNYRHETTGLRPGLSVRYSGRWVLEGGLIS